MAACSIHSIYNWDFIYDQSCYSRFTGSSLPAKDETSGVTTIKIFHTFCMEIFGTNGQHLMWYGYQQLQFWTEISFCNLGISSLQYLGNIVVHETKMLRYSCHQSAYNRTIRSSLLCHECSLYININSLEREKKK